MKTLFRITHSANIRPLSFGMALLASLTLCSTMAIAAKGGGKGNPGGGGGGEDPPPAPIGELPEMSATAINYEVRMLDAENPADWADSSPPWAGESNVQVYFRDINRDGVAVGNVYLPDTNTGYAIMATATGGLQQLDTVFAESLAKPEFDGFRLRTSYEINAAGWVGCSLIHAASDDRWVAVGNINAADSLKIISGPLRVKLGPLVSDLNEDGDLIAVESILTGKRSPNLEYNHWLHLATKDSNGDLLYVESPVYLTPFLSKNYSHTPQLNTTNLQIAYDSEQEVHRLDLANSEDIVVPDGPHHLITRIADDGSVYTFKITQEPSRKNEEQGFPSRWTPETGLQPLDETQSPGTALWVINVSSALVSEGETAEVLMSRGETALSDEDLAIYRPDESWGTRFPVSVSAGDLAVWDATQNHEAEAISRVNGSGNGLICGQAYIDLTFRNRKGFILTPIPAGTP